MRPLRRRGSFRSTIAVGGLAIAGLLAAPLSSASADRAPRGSAVASRAAGPKADVVRALERATLRLGRTRMADRTVGVLDSGRQTVSFRPGVRAITVEGRRPSVLALLLTGRATRSTGSRGFGMRNGGGPPQKQLSSADRVELGRLIAEHFPHATPRDVRRGVRAAIKQHRALEARTDPLIAKILTGVAETRRQGVKTEVKLGKGVRGGDVVYHPDRDVLVGHDPIGWRSFPLERGALRPRARAELRDFLAGTHR